MTTQSSEPTNAELAARIEAHIDQIIVHLERWSLPEVTSQADVESVIQAGIAQDQHDFDTNFKDTYFKDTYFKDTYFKDTYFKDTYLAKLPSALSVAKDYKGRATAFVSESEKLLDEIESMGCGNTEHKELVNRALFTEARLNSFKKNVRLNLEGVENGLQSALQDYAWSNVYADRSAILWAKGVFTPKVNGESGVESGLQQPLAFFGLYSLTGFLQYFSTLSID